MKTACDGWRKVLDDPEFHSLVTTSVSAAT